MSTPARIGFVGVGGMGAGMVARLLAAGWPVAVLGHRNRAPVEAAVAQGASEAPDLAALAAGCDVLMLCVRNADIAEALVTEAAAHLAEGALVIDTGTAPPEVPRRMAALLAASGIDFAEAPVTGGVGQASEGSLGALVGASPEAFARAEPILEAFSATIRHFGPPGQAATAKLLNNAMVLGIVALITETFGKAAKAGVDWDDLYAVAIRGAGDSGALRRIMGAAVEGDFGGYVFDVAGALKDLTYFKAAASGIDGDSELASAVRGVFAKAVEAGHGDRLLSELLHPDLRS